MSFMLSSLSKFTDKLSEELHENKSVQINVTILNIYTIKNETTKILIIKTVFLKILEIKIA